MCPVNARQCTKKAEKGQPGAKLNRETVGMSDSYRSSHSGAQALQLGVPHRRLSCVQVDKPIPACSRRPGPEPGREQNEAAGSVGSQGATGRHVLLSQQYCLTWHKAHATGTEPMGCQAGLWACSIQGLYLPWLVPKPPGPFSSDLDGSSGAF